MASALASFPSSTERVLLGASRAAADDLVRELTRVRGATFGIHRLSLSQLIGRLASAALAAEGSAPATPLGVQALAARIAFEAREAEELHRLEPVSRCPGFARALAATLTELRLGRVSSAELSMDPEIQNLFVRYAGALVEGRLADRAAMIELASQAIESGAPDPLLDAPIALLDAPLRNRAERELVRALARRAPAMTASVPALDRETRAALEEIGNVDVVDLDENAPREVALERLRANVFVEEEPEGGAPDASVSFFSAPGEGRECVEIARRVMATARTGVPFDEIAVLLRAPETYAGLLEEAFARAGIPGWFARGSARPDRTGRAFLALLDCRSERLSARRFAEYLSFAVVPDLPPGGAPPTDRRTWVGPQEEEMGAGAAKATQLSLFGARDVSEAAPPDPDRAPAVAGRLRAPWKWEEFLVEAAVIGGKERWRARLRGLEQELVRKHETLEREDPGASRNVRLEREIENLRHLERFVLPVVETLDAYPSRTCWGDWLERLEVLAPMVLDRPERVLSLLAELRPMAAVDGVSIAEVREVLARRLSALDPDPPVSRYGRVFVATPEDARGRSFRTVFVPGLAERVFPRPPREDPLLLDVRRREISGSLVTREGRGHEERLRLRLAIGAASESLVLSYSRVDVGDARPRVPSFYALDVARAVRGEMPHHAELEREAADAAKARLAWPAPLDPASAIDPMEHDLSVLGGLLASEDPVARRGRARYLLELNPCVRRSLRTRYKRWRRRWQDVDGLVRTTEATEPALRANRPLARPYSVSALQRYAVCPYQFLLAGLHRLEPRPEAVPLVRMDPLTRGRLVHEVQAETFRALERDGLLPVTKRGLANARVAVDRVLDRVAASYREELAPAIPRVFADEVELVRADLRAWVGRMPDESASHRPLHFELGFGLEDRAGLDAASVRDPVRIPGEWLLRGAVDLVEENKNDGSLRVTDHKTGANRTKPGLVVGGGRTLQPVLYGLAIERALGRPVSSARLYFTSARGGFTERAVALDERARQYARRVMELIDEAVTGGHLPPMPEKGACAHCDFRMVCGPGEEARTRRKEGGPMRELLELRDLP